MLLVGKETPRSAFQEGWDTKQSHSWLSDGRLQAQTEGLVVAVKDSLSPNSRAMVPELCHVCSLRPETLSHVLSNSEPMKWTSP